MAYLKNRVITTVRQGLFHYGSQDFIPLQPLIPDSFFQGMGSIRLSNIVVRKTGKFIRVTLNQLGEGLISTAGGENHPLQTDTVNFRSPTVRSLHGVVYGWLRGWEAKFRQPGCLGRAVLQLLKPLVPVFGNIPLPPGGQPVICSNGKMQMHIHNLEIPNKSHFFLLSRDGSWHFHGVHPILFFLLSLPIVFQKKTGRKTTQNKPVSIPL